MLRCATVASPVPVRAATQVALVSKPDQNLSTLWLPKIIVLEPNNRAHHGHIMLYLGNVKSGDYAISAVYELHSGCPGKGDAEVIVARTLVTDLRVGKGSKRGAFLERITRVARFGE